MKVSCECVLLYLSNMLLKEMSRSNIRKMISVRLSVITLTLLQESVKLLLLSLSFHRGGSSIRLSSKPQPCTSKLSVFFKLLKLFLILARYKFNISAVLVVLMLASFYSLFFFTKAATFFHAVIIIVVSWGHTYFNVSCLVLAVSAVSVVSVSVRVLFTSFFCVNFNRKLSLLLIRSGITFLVTTHKSLLDILLDTIPAFQIVIVQITSWDRDVNPRGHSNTVGFGLTTSRRIEESVSILPKHCH